MGFVIVAGILFLIAVGFGIAAFLVQRRDDKVGCGVVTGIALLLTFVILLFGSWNQVSSPNIGIEYKFGKPVSHVTSGLHFLAPWANVVTINGGVQTSTYEGKNCLTVRVADQQTACVDVSVQWRINPADVDTLVNTYNNGGSPMNEIRNSLVGRRLEVNLSNQFGNYSPITSLTSTYKVGTVQNPSVSDLATGVAAAMRQDMNNQVFIRDVLIPRVTYDAQVQARINSVLAQVANTDIAKQSIQTAEAQAQAFQKLEASLRNNPDVLASRCEDIVTEAIKANYQLPASYGNCVSGGNNVAVLAGGNTSRAVK